MANHLTNIVIVHGCLLGYTHYTAASTTAAPITAAPTPVPTREQRLAVIALLLTVIRVHAAAWGTEQRLEVLMLVSLLMFRLK
jgi:hypothetical protein